MVRVSLLLTPPTVTVTMMFDEETEMLAAVISPLPRKATLPTPGLNCHPSGPVKMRGWFVPTAKSAFAPSVSTMFPKDTKAAPLVEFRATSVGTLFPPVGSVTATSANSRLTVKAVRNKLRQNRSDIFFMFPTGRHIAAQSPKDRAFLEQMFQPSNRLV